MKKLIRFLRVQIRAIRYENKVRTAFQKAKEIDKTSPHQHVWKKEIENDDRFLIATSPPLYSYTCECGAFTHDPYTGKPCDICNVDDFSKRRNEPFQKSTNGI